MKSKEVKWISRDADGGYAVWKKKPQKGDDGSWDCMEENGIIQIGADSWERLGINLACGALAKVVVTKEY